MTRTPTAPGVRPGHFVEGRWFPLSAPSQAAARAAYLATTYGRAVYVATRRDIGGDVVITHTAARASSAVGLFATVGV